MKKLRSGILALVAAAVLGAAVAACSSEPIAPAGVRPNLTSDSTTTTTSSDTTTERGGGVIGSGH